MAAGDTNARLRGRRSSSEEWESAPAERAHHEEGDCASCAVVPELPRFHHSGAQRPPARGYFTSSEEFDVAQHDAPPRGYVAVQLEQKCRHYKAPPALAQLYPRGAGGPGGGGVVPPPSAAAVIEEEDGRRGGLLGRLVSGLAAAVASAGAVQIEFFTYLFTAEEQYGGGNGGQKEPQGPTAAGWGTAGGALRRGPRKSQVAPEPLRSRYLMMSGGITAAAAAV